LQNIIVVYEYLMNFFYVSIVPGLILKHLVEFGKIRLLPGDNTRFLSEGGQYVYLKDIPIFEEIIQKNTRTFMGNFLLSFSKRKKSNIFEWKFIVLFLKQYKK